MRKNIFTQLIFSGIFLTSIQVSFASDVNNNFEASEKIENFCSIQANDVNFGVVALPLTAQSANSQMRILCSNNAPYKVDLAYGNYASGIILDGYTIEYNYTNDNHSVHSINDSSNKPYAVLSCGYSPYYLGKVYITGPNFAKIYGYTSGVWQADTKKICTSDGTKAGTYPTGWVGAYNAPGQQPLNISTASEFGSMSGTQKGDKLAYKITLPNDSAKTWTKSVNAYSSIGVGTEQLITVNAQIVPDKSSSKYIAQDVYIDNVTAEITY